MLFVVYIMKKSKIMKILIGIAIIIAILTPVQLYVLGSMGGIGPLKHLQAERISKLPGNAEIYNFSTIEQMENSPLSGGNICILGSSVVYGSASNQQAVGEYLAARFGCQLTKEAVSGTTLVDTGKNSYVQRLQNNLPKDAQFDLFICQLSTNDATSKRPLGEISESKDIEDFDTSTVAGSLEFIICYAQQSWDCPVVFFTGSHYESEAYDAMVNLLLKLEDKWDICVLDLWTDSEFNAISDEDRSLYMSDKIHPTRAGYREWWGPEMERQLIEFLSIAE